MNNNHYCVIMAGGSGSRLWPASTTSCPKQFMDIADIGKTSLRDTYDRFSTIIPKDNIIIVTVQKYRDLVMQEIPELDGKNLLVEPYARDTAPCIAYSAYALYKRDPDATMIVTPADHLIEDDDNFRDAICKAAEFASANDVLMTLGITPTRPDPNFGYIQVTGGSAADRKEGAIKVKTFTEKPDVSLAKVFIDSGEFFWNSGIFAWKAISCRVGDVDDCGPRLDHSFNDTGKIFILGPSGIFCVEFDVFNIFFRILHRGDCPFEDILTVRIEFILYVIVGRAYTGMDSLQSGEMKRICSGVDILFHSPRQGADSGFRDDFRNFHYGFEVSRTRNREAALDDVHLHGFELLGQFYLLYRVQLAAWDLFAVPQCGVKDVKFLLHIFSF